jgi:hypothetical protein
LIAAVLWAATIVLIRTMSLARMAATKMLLYQLAVSAVLLPVDADAGSVHNAAEAKLLVAYFINEGRNVLNPGMNNNMASVIKSKTNSIDAPR